MDGSIGSTAFFFGIITLALYFFIVRPLVERRPGVAAGAAAANDRDHGGGRNAAAAAAAPVINMKTAVKCNRVPLHVSDHATAVNGGNNLLSDGLISFKHTRASESTDSETRKARAKLLSSLLTGAPPAKGSAVAVTIPRDSVDCEKQRRVLFLLATYFNLFVLLAVDSEDFTERDAAVATLRGDSLTAAILPDHRILVASSVAGRVAFVRQLQRVELCLDFDPEVKQLLSRFGHRVVVYSDVGSSSDDSTVSQLGRILL